MSINGRTRIAFVLVASLACAGAAAADDIPRTPNGKPDFSGNYDISTLTPIQRSPELGERLTLTEAEAEEIRLREARNIATRSRASDPDRTAPPVGGNIGAYNYFFMDRGTSAVKVGGKYRTSVLTDPPNGRFPPLTERGKARRDGLYGFSKKNTGPAWWRDREVGPYDGPESLSIADRCVFSLEATIPIYSKSYNNIKTIVQTDTHLVILIEWMHYARIIPISPSREAAMHLPESDPFPRRRLGCLVGRRHARHRHDELPGRELDRDDPVPRAVATRRPACDRTLLLPGSGHAALSVHPRERRLGSALQRRVHVAGH